MAPAPITFSNFKIVAADIRDSLKVLAEPTRSRRAATGAACRDTIALSNTNSSCTVSCTTPSFDMAKSPNAADRSRSAAILSHSVMPEHFVNYVQNGAGDGREARDMSGQLKCAGCEPRNYKYFRSGNNAKRQSFANGFRHVRLPDRAKPTPPTSSSLGCSTRPCRVEPQLGDEGRYFQYGLVFGMIEEIDVLLDQTNARVIVMRITSDPSNSK
jgi:hypothetical protein